MNGWDFVLQFLYLGVFIGIALILKINFKGLSKHLIPTCMIAGILAFLFGSEGLGALITWISGAPTRIFVPFNRDLLFTSVTHLMSIGFIALALKDRAGSNNRAVVKTGFAIVNTYLWQAIIGFGITLLLAYTIFPEISVMLGLLLPLSFAQGPGQATSIGTQWNASGVLPGGANIGAMIATIGFLWAIIVGIILMNILVKKRGFKVSGGTDTVGSIDIDKASKHTSSIPKSAFVDDLTIQIILIGFVYLLTYGVIEGLSFFLKDLGTFGETLSGLFRGFAFLFGTIIAVGVKAIFKKLRNKGHMKINYVDNYLMQKISAVSFDFMITASIAALSFTALGNYGWSILILTTVGGVFTIFYTIFMAKFIYREEVLENTLALFGTWTGTITTGVALLKEVDPKGKTSVTDNLVLGSGIAAPLGFPLMMILAIPVTGMLENKPWLYGLTFALFFAYSAVMMILMHVLNKREDKALAEEKSKK
jgi:glutamate:Na+ symporter, ESS family